MVQPGREPLTDEDELFIGGVEPGKGKRHLGETKALVAAAAEVRGQGISRIRLQRIPDASGQSASALLPRVHRVAALLKRWLLGIHQGAVSWEYLDGYLDEFTFRFNRRLSRHREKLFYRLIQQAVTIRPCPTGPW